MAEFAKDSVRKSRTFIINNSEITRIECLLRDIGFYVHIYAQNTDDLTNLLSVFREHEIRSELIHTREPYLKVPVPIPVFDNDKAHVVYDLLTKATKDFGHDASIANHIQQTLLMGGINMFIEQQKTVAASAFPMHRPSHDLNPPADTISKTPHSIDMNLESSELNENLIESVFSHIAQIEQNTDHHLHPAAKMLLNKYLNYLVALENGQTFSAEMTLKGQLRLFCGEIAGVIEMIQDIEKQGLQQQKIIQEDDNLIERLRTIRMDLSCKVEHKYPRSLHTGRSAIENIVLKPGTVPSINPLKEPREVPPKKESILHGPEKIDANPTGFLNPPVKYGGTAYFSFYGKRVTHKSPRGFANDTSNDLSPPKHLSICFWRKVFAHEPFNLVKSKIDDFLRHYSVNHAFYNDEGTPIGTLLSFAAEHALSSVLKYLLEKGADLNFSARSSGYTAFNAACKSERFDNALYLFSQKPHQNDKALNCFSVKVTALTAERFIARKTLLKELLKLGSYPDEHTVIVDEIFDGKFITEIRALQEAIMHENPHLVLINNRLTSTEQTMSEEDNMQNSTKTL